ncbi:MAG: alpha/beta fold hydrolase [archaeon]
MIEIYIVVIFLLLVLRKIRLVFNRRRLYKKLQPFKINEKAKPYFYKQGKICCLLLHGYTSTPDDFRYLTPFLLKKKLSVHTPLLKGHGTDPLDLANTNYKDWMKSAEDALEKVEKQYNKIFIIGNSIGGNLAFLLKQNKKVKGIISLGTPLFFRFGLTIRLFLPFMYLFKDFQKKYYPEEIRKVIEDNKKVHYKYYPVNTAFSVLKIMKMTKKNLVNIEKPVLVMQSSKDITLDNDNALYIFNKIKSINKKLVFIPDSYHVFIMDKYKEMAFDEIYEFIKSNS